MQDRHEVRLTGTEGAVEIGGLRGVPVEGRLDQAERLVEVLEEPLGDDVVPQRMGCTLVCDGLCELQHEVGGGDRRLDVDDVAEQWGRAGGVRGHLCLASPGSCVLVVVRAWTAGRSPGRGSNHGLFPRAPGVLSSAVALTAAARPRS